MTPRVVLGAAPAATGMSAPQAAPDAAQAETATKALFAAFGSLDAAAMKEHFADTVQFIGDPQFLGESRGPQVMRNLKRDQLIDAYTKMFSTVDPLRWKDLAKQLKPTLKRATVAGSHPEDTTGLLPADFVKAGEYLFELKAPGSGLDDVILFVLRPIDGRWKVIAHWADY
jgi:hypothetical protein